MSDKLAYSIREAAEATGACRRTLERRIAEGGLPARKWGGKTVILAEDLKAYLAALPAVGKELH